MKDADKQLMDGLGMVTDLPQDQWALVVADVEKAGGVRAVGGQARVEIQRAVAKARTLVTKHPGHGDQSVHGGARGKGGNRNNPADREQHSMASQRERGSEESAADREQRSMAREREKESVDRGKVDEIRNSPDYQKKTAELDSAINDHYDAVSNSKLPNDVKREALTYLKDAKEARDRMKSAKTPGELSRAHGDAIDAGENYKGTIRAHGENLRSRHYRAGGAMAKPYKEKNLLPKGLTDNDIQDLADGLPIPFAD